MGNPRCQLESLIHKTIHATFYSGRFDEREPAIIKVSYEHIASRALARFRHEYQVLAELDLDVVPRVLGLLWANGRYMLAMADFDARPLAALLNAGPLSPDEFIPVAIAVAKAVGALHSRHVIHLDLNPHTIWLEPDHTAVKLVNLDISSRLSNQQPELKAPELIEGTLAYVAPEQTGRMNRLVDGRADYYSLGVTFYEMLTGAVPFVSDDPLELIHAHIARAPKPPHDLDGRIPQVLSNIVLKLLSKNAEDRYQSAFALAYDLEVCRTFLRESGSGAPVVLGERDISQRFDIPETLYGRKEEQKALFDAFQRICQGSVEMVLLAGYSGIGKTSLVGEMQKPICAHRGYFIAGKFEQLQRDIPYACLAQAFRDLVGQILSESDERIAAWRRTLHRVLGRSSGVLTEVIPELERIIGKQPMPPPLDPVAAQNRLNVLFIKLVEVFARQDHPLVIFLDDLQWADSASLHLVQLMMSEPRLKYLLIVAAYRDNEVSPAHPFIQTMERIKASRAAVTRLTLAPLPQHDIERLLADTLHADTEGDEVRELASLLIHKTGGNPFFLKQLLRSIYRRGYFVFNPETGRWAWDMSSIVELDMTDNVLDLLASTISQLPQATIRVMQLAACIGNRFDLATLATVAEAPAGEIANALWPAFERGLVQPIGTNYKLVGGNLNIPALPEDLDIQGDLHAVAYRFLHDRIQQATYALVASDDRERLHLRIGRLLAASGAASEQDPRFFDTVHHLNHGRRLITDVDESRHLARLNLAAGRKAKQANAYVSALAFVRSGTAILDDESYSSEYELWKALHIECAACEYLNTNFAIAEEQFAVLMDKLRSDIDKAEVCALQVLLYTNRGQSLRAVELGLAGLAMLGVSLPLHPDSSQVTTRVESLRAELAQYGMDALHSLAPASHPSTLAAMRICSSLGSPAFFVDRSLYTLINLTLVKLTLHHGTSADSFRGYVVYGMVLGSTFGDYANGYAFARLGISLAEKFAQPNSIGMSHFLSGFFVAHWSAHGRVSAEHLRISYGYFFDVGNIVYASYAAASYIAWRIINGDNLDECLRECEEYLRFVESVKFEAWANYMRSSRYCILRLQGADIDDADLMNNMRSNDIAAPIHWHYITRLRLAYLSGDYAAAQAAAEHSEAMLDVSKATLWLAEHYFYCGLLDAHLLITGEAPDRQKQLARLRECREMMQRWAAYTAESFAHKEWLLRAELMRVEEPSSLAIIDCYERAMELGRQQGYTHVAAIAAERCGQLLADRGNPTIARYYFAEAVSLYSLWGASAKAAMLAQRAPGMALSGEASPRQALAQAPTSGDLDARSVLKASQAISGVLVLGDLLDILMRTAVESAGAGRGALMLVQPDRSLRVEVMVPEGTLTEPVAVAECDCVPQQIVHYVAHSLDSVVLDDAAASARFASDTYVAAHRPASVMCLPVVRQRELVAVLYLENNLVAGAFTSGRREVLEVLAAQAAISLENARLYDDLDQRVQERTRELRDAHEQLAEIAHRAGMAEIASSVLHNVGNLLNSVATGVGVLTMRMNTLRDDQLAQTTKLLAAHVGNNRELALGGKGQTILQYLQKLAEYQAAWKGGVTAELQAISGNINRIAEVLARQQEYASGARRRAAVDVRAMIERVLAEHEEEARAHHIEMGCEIESLPALMLEQYGVSRVVEELIRNGLGALTDAPQPRQLSVEAWAEDKWLYIEVIDTGLGIAAEKLSKIFHQEVLSDPSIGRGLHRAAVTASAMGGHLSAESDGIGSGSRFTLRLPLVPAKA